MIFNFSKQSVLPGRALRIFAIVLCLGVAVTWISSDVIADEIVLDESTDDFLRGGDFECRPCYEPVDSSLQIASGLGDQSGHITTGELYRFFKENGIDSIDRLVLCLDVKPNQKKNGDLSFQDVVLTIEDPFQSGSNSFSLDRDGDNSLIVPGYEASALKPEAQLEIPLGYDFMERFSENSTEKIQLDFQVNGEKVEALPLAVYFSGTNTAETSYLNGGRILLIVAFVLFWLIVFWALFKFTLPSTKPATN